MNYVKMSLVALMLSVVLLGCSGMGLLKNSPENKIQGQWRIFSRELAYEDVCRALEYKHDALSGNKILIFNNKSEFIRTDVEQNELGKDRYFIRGDQLVIVQDGMEKDYKFDIENDVLIVRLSDRDIMEFKRVDKDSSALQQSQKPEDKIQGRWQLLSQKIVYEQDCKALDDRVDDIGVIFNKQNDFISATFNKKIFSNDKYYIQGNQLIIIKDKKKIFYNFNFLNDRLIIHISGKDMIKLKRVNKISKISKPESIHGMQPFLHLLKLLEQSDRTSFEEILSTQLKSSLGKEGIDREFMDKIRFFQEKEDSSEQSEFMLEENSQKELTIYRKKLCRDIVLDVIKEGENWKINNILLGGCAGNS